MSVYKCTLTFCRTCSQLSQVTIVGIVFHSIVTGYDYCIYDNKQCASRVLHDLHIHMPMSPFLHVTFPYKRLLIINTPYGCDMFLHNNFLPLHFSFALWTLSQTNLQQFAVKLHTRHWYTLYLRLLRYKNNNYLSHVFLFK